MRSVHLRDGISEEAREFWKKAGTLYEYVEKMDEIAMTYRVVDPGGTSEVVLVTEASGVSKDSWVR